LVFPIYLKRFKEFYRGNFKTLKIGGFSDNSVAWRRPALKRKKLDFQGIDGYSEE
jgi:hypothetical protein